MGICTGCHQEMMRGISCSVVFYGRDRRVLHKGKDACHDCYCPPNGYHHPGCDAERCPKCGGQVISCRCYSASHEDDRG